MFVKDEGEGGAYLQGRNTPGQECLEGKWGTEDLVSRSYPLCSHHIEVARHLNGDQGVGREEKKFVPSADLCLLT